MDRWNTLPWTRIQRNVCKLPKRIYRASCRGDVPTVRKLQRLRMPSWSAKLLAVRRVTQDNGGQQTAGIDGVQSLTAPQRLQLAQTCALDETASPVRRAWIPKPGSPDKRPLGIPPMTDRARQTMVKYALEPEWDARFAPNRSGFRPGRSCHDAITAIRTAIGHKAKYVLDADIEKCCDRINQTAFLAQVNPGPRLRRQLKAWLHAGAVDQGTWFPPEAGTMPGRPLSPLLANIALHGLETHIRTQCPRSGSRGFQSPNVVVYADDLVILHEAHTIIQRCQDEVTTGLHTMGLTLKPSKTRITHTLDMGPEKPGFDLLGFHLQQSPAGKTTSGQDCRGRLHGFKTYITPRPTAIQRHVDALRETIARHTHADQARLMQALNPQLRGWSQY